jgi:hypothetical protein
MKVTEKLGISRNGGVISQRTAHIESEEKPISAKIRVMAHQCQSESQYG